MAGGGAREGRRSTIVYCIVPGDLAGKLHEPLRRHFAADPSVEVVVERRNGERRLTPERRRGAGEPPAAERREIRTPRGRRAGERREASVAIDAPPLPRRARPFADRLAFVERADMPRSDEDIDSARLVTRFQAGDRDAFAELYMRYFSRVYAYLRVALRSREEAEDVAQQVFTRAFEALPKYEHRGPFRGWLFAIARNQAISHLRAAQRLEPLDPDDLNRRRDQSAESGPLPALEWISDPDLLLFIERLPLAQRQVLVLRYMLDLDHAEIAAVLHRSPEDVRKLQSRAQRFLRDRLDALAQRAEVECRPRMVRRPAHHYILRRRRYALMRSAKGSGLING